MINPNIILVHGLFMSGITMTYLSNFFKQQGYSTTIFSYHTVRDTPEKCANDFKNFIESQDDHNIIVCHSLGGLLTQKAFTLMDHPERKVQKVISLGTPWQGASILSLMQPYHLDAIVGKSLEILLPKQPNEWLFPEILLGSIAGQSVLGARLLFSPNDKTETDGTVTINETKIKGMTDHTVIPVSHTALIFSKLSAQKALQFVQTGSFSHNDH